MEYRENTVSDAKFAIIQKNIAELNFECSDILCKRCFAILEYVRVIFEDFLGLWSFDETIRFLSEGNLRDLIAKFVSAENIELPEELCEKETKRLSRQLTRFDEMYLCSKLVAACEKHFGVSGTEALVGALLHLNLVSFDDAESAHTAKKLNGPDRIACLKNSYTDKAYERWKNLLYEPIVSYCGNFTDVCEAVYYGNTKFCILPVENSKEGRLSAFYQLIRKYDLKIVSCCYVQSSDGEEATKFALLKKSLDFEVLYRDEVYFEFFTALESANLLCDILSAADDFGLRLIRMDSMPLDYAVNEYSYNLIFAVQNADFAAFLCYLKLKAPRFVTVGLYDDAKRNSGVGRKT